MKKILLIIGYALFLINVVRSQSVQPAITNVSFVNQLCPDFIFDTLINYKKEKLTIADLKGKFVIIDFWGTFCLPCITAFPKIEKLQRQFGDSLQVLLVATDGYQKAKRFYESREKMNRSMSLPCAINRNVVKYFQIKTVSTYVWIDDQGYIKAITDDAGLTDQNIANFIGKKDLHIKEKEKNVNWDHKRPLAAVASEMDSSNVIYSASLTKYLKGITAGYYYPKKGIGTKVFAHNSSINTLYRMAFGDSSGAVKYNRLIIESAHPEKFAPPKDGDFEKWKYDHAYCYELTVPIDKQNDILKIMREDLKRLFRANVYMENRSVKCLILKAEKKSCCLPEKTSVPRRVYNAGGITITNHPFHEFVDMVRHYMQDKIVLDETGITGNVDIVLEAQMNEVDAINESLKKYGLHLQYEHRTVPMLVIKDQ
jgi:thiol-disulfide isomerase/thioredoxin